MSRKLFLVISAIITALAAYVLFFSGIMPGKTRVVLVVEDEALTEIFRDFNRKNPDIILDVVVKAGYIGEEYVASGKADMWLPPDSWAMETAENRYRYKYDDKLYGKLEKIAFTPMIFVSASERYAYTSKMSVQEICKNITRPTNWLDINGKAEWGRFRFDCPRPVYYEEGADCISLFIHHYFMAQNDPRGKIGLKELDDENVRELIRSLLQNVSMESTQGKYSVIDLFRTVSNPKADMCVLYEQVFLSTVEYDARDWSKVRIHYPDGMTVSKPRYLVSMAKSLENSEKAEAISRFTEYMLSDDVQLAFINLGYRPVKTTEAANAALSELEERFGDYGFRVELPELRDSMDYAFVRQFQDFLRDYMPD